MTHPPLSSIYCGPLPNNGKGEFGAVAPYRCEMCGPVWSVRGDRRNDCDRCERCGFEVETNQDGRRFHVAHRYTIHKGHELAA